MSYSADVNVLLYASDQASPRHHEAIRFLRNRASDPELFLHFLVDADGVHSDFHPSKHILSIRFLLKRPWEILRVF